MSQDFRIHRLETKQINAARCAAESMIIGVCRADLSGPERALAEYIVMAEWALHRATLLRDEIDTIAEEKAARDETIKKRYE